MLIFKKTSPTLSTVKKEKIHYNKKLFKVTGRKGFILMYISRESYQEFQQTGFQGIKHAWSPITKILKIKKIVILPEGIFPGYVFL